MEVQRYGAAGGSMALLRQAIKGLGYVKKVYQTARESIDQSMPSRKRKATQWKRNTKRKQSEPKRMVRKGKGGSPGNNNSVVSATYKTGNVRKTRRSKSVKVSRSLRKKILKVLDSDKVVGKYLHVSYYQFVPGKPYGGGTEDQQSYEYCGMLTSTGGGVPALDRLLFSPMWVMYSVGRLMNATLVTKPQGQPITFTDFTSGNVDEAKHLDIKTARIKVLKQHATYRIRNNTGRNVTLKAFVLQPKSVDQVNTVGTNPLDVWNSGLDLQDFSTAKGENPTACRIETLYNNPKFVSQFKQHYKIEETIINLEAGKEHNFKVEGPSMEYDFAKFWLNLQFYDKQKFTKQVLFLAHNDLVRTSGGTTGRYTDLALNDSNSIIIEQTAYIKFAIPEQTGFVINPSFILGQNQTLNQKRYCFGIDVHQGTQVGVVDYVGDENPIDDANANVV